MTRAILTLLLALVLASIIEAQEEYTAQIGDTITVTVQEREWLSGARVVDVNGQIILPTPVGALKVLGLTASQSAELLTDRLQEIIVAPNVSVLISPASRFTVHIMGEVQAPSTFEVVAGTSLQAAISKAGGFTSLADKKRIKIIRQDLKRIDTVSERVIDFTQFHEHADPASNPPLKVEDVVIVPRLPGPERRVITVIGAVNQPGALTIEEESLSLIEAMVRAGGPSTNAALEHLSVLRPEGDGYLKTQVNLEDFLTAVNREANPTVSPGGIIFVPNKQFRQETVNVIGAIIKPGSYPLYESGRLFDVLYAAGGFAKGAAIDEVAIIRASNPHPEKIPVRAKNYLMTGDLQYNPLLATGDTVFIPVQEEAIKNFSEIQTAFFESILVTLIGEVRAPDTYQVSKTATVLDVLSLAGGPTQSADLERVTIIRPHMQLQIDLEQALQEGNLQLFPPLETGDTIRVPPIEQKGSRLKSVLGIARDLASILTVYLLVRRQVRGQ